MDIINEQCKNCVFFKAIQYEKDGIEYEDEIGECRRYPPKRIDSDYSGFPLVSEDVWCGEFKHL